MTRRKRFAVILQVALLCVLTISGPVCSAAEPMPPQAVRSQSAQEILDLTNQLLFKEIDLERFYLRYRMWGTQEPKYRRLRFFLLQQSAAGGFLASNIINMVETAKHFDTPEETSSKVLANSCTIGEVASIMGGSASALELGSDCFTALKNKLKKRDPGSQKRSVVERLKEIDELAARRNALVEQSRDSASYELYIAEGNVLKSFRDWCVYEFMDVYADVKSYHSSCNVFYVLDVAAYSTSWVAYQLAVRAFKHQGLAYPALHNGFVSDSLFTVEAPAYAASAKLLYNHYYKKIAKQLNEKPKNTEDEAKLHMYKLESLAANADDTTLSTIGPIATRLAVYDFWSTRYDKYISTRMSDVRRLNQIALQSTVTGPLLGATGLTQDAVNAVGLYGWKNNKFMPNALAFAGATTTACGSAASIGLTGWWFIDQLRHERHEQHMKVLPLELLEQRIRTLETLEDMLGRQDQ